MARAAVAVLALALLGRAAPAQEPAGAPCTVPAPDQRP